MQYMKRGCLNNHGKFCSIDCIDCLPTLHIYVFLSGSRTIRLLLAECIGRLHACSKAAKRRHNMKLLVSIDV